jgi:hypothetical protein
MNNKGMTFIGMLLTMAIVIIVAVVAMRIVPVYIEYYSVNNSIDALEKVPNSEFTSDPAANAQVLKDKLVNQLYVNSIEFAPEVISIAPKDNGAYDVSIKYQVLKHLLGNISLLFNFDINKEVTVGPK